ncbi:MAG: iron-sulfur cluster assembly accessory protein [Frankia sp.]|nr:iron-sulfur cluster assembly accessory protein [Frankia sp.]
MTTRTAPGVPTGTELAIELTDRAARRVRSLLDSDAATAGFGLRIGVEAGGCSGYQYSLALAPEAGPEDLVVGQDGFEVFVSRTMAPLLHGVRIDYVESLTSSGFTFSNPNASDSCGCGNSFAATAAAEQSAADAALRALVEQAMADIRPYLQRDGGDATVVSVVDGVVSVRLTGACGGCSMASGTVTGVIERRLKELLPEVRRVTLVP